MVAGGGIAGADDLLDSSVGGFSSIVDF